MQPSQTKLPRLIFIVFLLVFLVIGVRHIPTSYISFVDAREGYISAVREYERQKSSIRHLQSEGYGVEEIEVKNDGSIHIRGVADSPEKDRPFSPSDMQFKVLKGR